MEASSKVIAMTMLDAYSKMLELSSVNNAIRENRVGSAKSFKFNLEAYQQDFSSTGRTPNLESYVESVSERMATDEILFTSKNAKNGFEQVTELYSRYGSLNKIVLGVK